MIISPIMGRFDSRKESRKVRAHIEIVGSTDTRINAMSADSRTTILAALQEQYTKVRITIVNNMDDLKQLVDKKPDLVVLGMRLVLLNPDKGYEASEKMWLADYFDKYGINYTGSEAEAMRLQFEKQDAKQRVLDAGLESSTYSISLLHKQTYEHSLRFPLFVKPSNLGHSKGIDEQSVVSNIQQLKSKIRSLHVDCETDVLIEEYLPGREFSVAVARQSGSKELYAMPIEIVPEADQMGNRFLSAAIKRADTEDVLPVHDPDLSASLRKLAIGAFTALGSRDYGRIDLRLNRLGKPSFIEANLMPGLSNHGYLSQCFAINTNTNYQGMISEVVALALERGNLPLGVNQIIGNVTFRTAGV